MIVVIILLCIPLLFVAVDAAFSLYEWQARIHIGRWNNRMQWQQAIETQARKWLKRTPTVKLTDNNRWVLYDILRGKYRNKTIQSWQEAGLLLGFGKKEAANYAVEKLAANTGDWKKKPQHIDEALLAYVLKKNGELTLAAEKSVLNFIINLKGEHNTVPYRSAIPEVRFVDTIGMVVPFLTICNERVFALNQVEEYDRAKLPHSSIPSHAYNMDHNLPLGIYDWSRGIGWYILGLVESNANGWLNSRIVTLATEMLTYQQDDGGWGAMFFNKKSRCESSGTALVGLLMLNAYRITTDPLFLDAAFKTERRLMTSTRRTGAIDFCQGDTKGIGYYSTVFSVMPFAQGIALKLSKELNEYANR